MTYIIPTFRLHHTQHKCCRNVSSFSLLLFIFVVWIISKLRQRLSLHCDHVFSRKGHHLPPSSQNWSTLHSTKKEPPCKVGMHANEKSESTEQRSRLFDCDSAILRKCSSEIDSRIELSELSSLNLVTVIFLMRSRFLSPLLTWLPGWEHHLYEWYDEAYRFDLLIIVHHRLITNGSPSLLKIYTRPFIDWLKGWV